LVVEWASRGQDVKKFGTLQWGSGYRDTWQTGSMEAKELVK
jgi:hypothetical protein